MFSIFQEQIWFDSRLAFLFKGWDGEHSASRTLNLFLFARYFLLQSNLLLICTFVFCFLLFSTSFACYLSFLRLVSFIHSLCMFPHPHLPSIFIQYLALFIHVSLLRTWGFRKNVSWSMCLNVSVNRNCSSLTII